MAAEKTETNDIIVNGERRRVPRGQTVGELIECLGLDGGRVAVELDRRIVRRAEWASTALEAGARLEIVHFVGGG